MRRFITKTSSPQTVKAHKKILTHKTYNEQDAGTQSSFATDSSELMLEKSIDKKRKLDSGLHRDDGMCDGGRHLREKGSYNCQ